MQTRALDVLAHRNHAERDRRGNARALDSRQRGEAFAQLLIKFLRVLRVVTGQAGVNFQKKTRARFQARFDRSSLVRAANEKRSRGQQRERERDLNNHERIARQKFPAASHHIFARLFLQIRHHRAPRKFERGPEREAERADQAKAEGGGKNREVRSAHPDDVEREHFAERRDEKIGRPEPEQKSEPAAEQREHETFGEKLTHNARAAAAQRETNRDFFAASGAAREQHVGEIKTRHHQHHDGHAEKQRRDLGSIRLRPADWCWWKNARPVSP